VRRADARTLERALPEGLAPRVAQLASAGDRLGLGVLLVGGPVRDLLLGRALVDVDLIVESRTGAVDDPARRLAEAAAGPGAALVAHARFGTVTLAGPGGAIDLAGARTETYAAPGALPEVRAAALEQDLARRDFSVNAMAMPLNETARAGRAPLVDSFGGRADLAGRRLRVLHLESFDDDPTRAFRAARLAARLAFRLEAGSRRALARALGARVCDAVSGERFRAELAKTFEDARRGGDPARALALLESWRVLAAVSRGLALAPAARRGLRSLGRELGAAAADPLVSGLSVWLAPLAAAPRRRALERLALRGRPAERVEGFPGLARRKLRALARARSRGAADAVLGALGPEELLALAAVAPAGERRRILRHAREDRAVRIPLGGEDALALGLTGAAVGRALAALRRAFLDGEWTAPEQGRAWLREHRLGARGARPRRLR
jgi:tRNA nucleotidyltransferase (CCA-adding enzyme)